MPVYVNGRKLGEVWDQFIPVGWSAYITHKGNGETFVELATLKKIDTTTTESPSIFKDLVKEFFENAATHYQTVPVSMDVVERAPASAHYDSGIEPIEYIQANDMGFIEGNIIKYVTRYKRKNGLEDLKKARWYLDKLIAAYTFNQEKQV
jgi:hypothetical protein